MLAATDALDRLFSNDSRVVRLARDLGIARKGINAGRMGSRAIFMSAWRQSLLLI